MSKYVCPYKECALFSTRFDNHCFKYTDIRYCSWWRKEDSQEREFQEKARRKKDE